MPHGASIGSSITYNFNYNILENTFPTGNTPVSVKVVGEDVHRGELGRWSFRKENWNSVLDLLTTVADDDLILIADASDGYKVKAITKANLTS